VSEFVRVAALSEVPPGSARCVRVGRKRVALFNVDGQIYAIDDTCTHAEASLSEGTVEGCEVVCPLHGARFDLRTGAALSLPAVIPVETYEVKVEGDEVFIRV